MAKKILGLVAAVLGLGLATSEYLGYKYYFKYRQLRLEARSLESAFPELEEALKKALFLRGERPFFRELSRLYLERAIGENEFGQPEKREAFLDLARQATARWIRSFPADGAAYFEMGKIYMLSNFPVLTYARRGREFMRRALELQPSSSFLKLNILYIFLTQADDLEAGEKAFLLTRLEPELKSNPPFLTELRRRWKENYGQSDSLDSLLLKLGLKLP